MILEYILMPFSLLLWREDIYKSLCTVFDGDCRVSGLLQSNFLTFIYACVLLRLMCDMIQPNLIFFIFFSCFAQNLVTSIDIWKNIFTVSITISSVLLFTFLIGNMQVSYIYIYMLLTCHFIFNLLCQFIFNKLNIVNLISMNYGFCVVRLAKRNYKIRGDKTENEGDRAMHNLQKAP